MINRPEIIINKIKDKSKLKGKDYVKKKFPAHWEQNQLDVWDKTKYSTPRVRIDNKIHFYSYLYDKGILENEETVNIDFLKKYFKYYNESISGLIKCFNYKYLDFYGDRDKIFDVKGGISFDGFSFTLDSLSDSINKIGTYAPLYAYVKREKDKILICGGRHRVLAIDKLINDGKWSGNKILCIFWDSYNENFETKLAVSNILLNEVLNGLNYISIDKIDDDFSYVTINNVVDLWITYRLLEKEIDFIIENYEDKLIENNILPSETINLRC